MGSGPRCYPKRVTVRSVHWMPAPLPPPDVLFRILEVTVPVFGIVLISLAYARWRPVDMSAANRLNLVLFIPALIFHALAERTEGELALGAAALGAAVIVLGSGLLAWPVARTLGWAPRTLAPPAMFNNSGNMGMPLAVLAFGEAALPMAVVLLVTTTVLQFTVGLIVLNGRLDIGALLRNPMLLATAAGLAAMALDWRIPALIEPGIAMLGDVAIPLMLVALGVRLSEGGLGAWRIGLVGGLLTPLTGLAIALPWIAWAQPPDALADNLLLYAVLPPAVMNFMLAERFGQEPGSVASIVAIGNALSLLIVPVALWWLL